MRHNHTGRQLGRNASHRKAMFRNMVTSLFEHGKISTTDAKAKELRKIADKLITLGKRGDLHARRRALSYVRSREIVAKLFDEIAPQFADRPGGYTRIIKLGYRRGDSASICLIELVTEPCVPKVKKKAPAQKAPAKDAKAKKTTKAKKTEAPVVKDAPAQDSAAVEAEAAIDAVVETAAEPAEDAAAAEAEAAIDAVVAEEAPAEKEEKA